MATAQGLDLEEDMMRGRLGFAALEDAVLRCTGCARPDDCTRWLDGRDAKAAAPVGAPPLFCRNEAFFAALKPEQSHG
ncbi:hypothetical protein J5474_08055 [Sagittula sp. M10.9X]|uniref:DUF6455 domain-containing protein n=2 Tax=Sagittula salina TaxID=2820268 RepID=A0A940MMI2_9RHOB|nr:hypothetical protein [Sagittula salina]